MAAIANLGNNFVTTGGNETVVATPSIGDLIIVVCGNSGRTADQRPTITDNNSSGTYTLVASATANTSVDSMWVFVRTAFITAASSTTFTFAPVAGDTGGGLVVLRATGIALLGAAAVRQVGVQNNQAAATPAPVLPTVPDPSNPILSCILNATSPGGVTAPAPAAPTTWTRHADVGYTVPTTGLDVATANDGRTYNATASKTITWGGASASAFASIALTFNGDDIGPTALARVSSRGAF